MRKVNVKVTLDLLIRADDDASIEDILEAWVNGEKNEMGEVEDMTLLASEVTDSR